MKKLLVCLLIVTLACNGPMEEITPAPAPPTSTPSLVPVGYYDCPCQQPQGISLHDWLGNLPWYGELEFGGWDCSQLTAYIEWLAENCGYDAVFTGRKRAGEIPGHVWLTIKEDPYEATGLYWINLETADPEYYKADIWFQDIYRAFEYSNRTADDALKAWAWWLTYPELYITEEE